MDAISIDWSLKRDGGLMYDVESSTSTSEVGNLMIFHRMSLSRHPPRC